MAEWSKALVLGTSHFDGVGSNPTTANTFFKLTEPLCRKFLLALRSISKGTTSLPT